MTIETSPRLLTIPIAVIAMSTPPTIAVAAAPVEVVRLDFDVGTIGQPASTPLNVGVEADIDNAVFIVG